MDLLSDRAVAKIYLNNILHNINEFKKIRKKNTKICAVVKADAYGHGSIEVSNFIQENVDYFAVSSGDEARELKLANIKKPVLILGYVCEKEIDELLKLDVEFTVYNIEVAKLISEKSQKFGKNTKIHIKLDTGMSRIGFLNQDDYLANIKSISEMPNIEIKGCFSHFTSADETKNDFTNIQYKLFCQMCNNIENMGINLGIKHIANSSASETDKYDLDMVRLGLGMYGYSMNDCKNEKLQLKPCLRLETVVSNIKYLDENNTVSYARKYKLDKKEWIATLPIGYADGISRIISNKDFEIIFDDKIKGVLIGNICMDQMMVRLSQKINIGTKAYFFGYDEMSGHYMANMSSTIVYEVLCAIHKRVKKEYFISGDIYIK